MKLTYKLLGGIVLRTGEGCRVVIVDDEQLIRQGIKHYVQWEQEGFQIVGEASNGQEALEVIERTNPHIVLTDIVMPIMDGEELTRIVKSRFPQIEIIILSSFGEFEYVRSTFQSGAVDYILKPKLDSEILLAVLKKAVERIPSLQQGTDDVEIQVSAETMIDKYLSGYESDYDEHFIQQAFPLPHFCLVAIDLRLNDGGKNQEEISEIVKKALITTIEGPIIQAFRVDSNVSAFLVNFSGERTNDRLEGVATQLENCAHVHDLSILLTNSFESFTQIGVKYNEVIKKMLQYRFYYPSVTLIEEQHLEQEVPKIDSFNLDKFTNDFKHERFDAAFTYLESHLTLLSSHYTTDILEYKSFFGNIIFTMSILLNNLEYNVKSLENEKFHYFNAIDEAKTASKVVEELQMFIEKAKEIIAANRSLSGQSNFQLILDFIEEHYSEPLSLTGVANHFHFNPSYLSSYFAAHNKEGFNEYLNRIRIEEAVKLLVQTTTPISEISGLVGYSDHSYFCKVFKKLKDQSPSQYRRNQKAK